MRIIIDLQGAQTESRFRGIGRYSLAITKAIVRNSSSHEIIIALNGLFPETIEHIRVEFDNLLPQKNIRVWYAPGPVFDVDPSNTKRREIAERIREAFLVSLQPDIVLITSLFEGISDNAVTSVGVFNKQIPVSIILYDLIPLISPDIHFKTNTILKDYYSRKIVSLKRAKSLLAISESSRREALDALPFEGSNVINISGACDSSFQVLDLPESEKKELCVRLGINQSFIMYTGGADERKNLPRLIKAYAQINREIRSNYQLLLVGKMPQNDVLNFQRTAKESGLEENECIFTGYTSDDDLLKLYNTCKLFVFPSLHEGFGLPPLEAMACGAPVIAATSTSLPEVIGLNEAMFNPESINAITDKMTQALSDNSFRSHLIKHGLARAKTFSWDRSAKRVLEALNRVNTNSGKKTTGATSNLPPSVLKQKHPRNIDKLIKSIAALDGNFDNRQMTAIARSIASNIPHSFSNKRLFVDISEMVHGDAKTGIQRVVRSLLHILLENPPQEYTVTPVYANTSNPGYFYANRFVCRFKGQKLSPDLLDDPIDFYAGDIFLGLDFQLHVIYKQKSFLQRMRRDGVKVTFIVYDMLPAQMPHNFIDGLEESFNNWLEIILGCDGAICISKAVADELVEWMEKNNIKHLRHFEVGWFHLGADVKNSRPTFGLPDDASSVLEVLKHYPSFLMVGTIEPRKGHLQALDAFEKLWSQNIEVNLVIIGKLGWKSDKFTARIHKHPAFGKHLFWLDGISDEYLEQIYTASTCLISASIGEGFGLPLIEAAQYKIPLIIRDIPVFREVAGEHAFYFSGRESKALAHAIKRWLELFAEDMHPKSDHLPWLTWKQSAEQLLKKVIH